MVFHLQPVMIITLLPLAIPVDGTAVSTSVLVFRASTLEEFGWTLLIILPAALLAFMLGVSEYLLVYHTSGLTLSISGVFKVREEGGREGGRRGRGRRGEGERKEEMEGEERTGRGEGKKRAQEGGREKAGGSEEERVSNY